MKNSQLEITRAQFDGDTAFLRVLTADTLNDLNKLNDSFLGVVYGLKIARLLIEAIMNYGAKNKPFNGVDGLLSVISDSQLSLTDFSTFLEGLTDDDQKDERGEKHDR